MPANSAMAVSLTLTPEREKADIRKVGDAPHYREKQNRIGQSDHGHSGLAEGKWSHPTQSNHRPRT